MGRYSSVQAYADNSSNNRAVSYEQATGSSEAKKGVGECRCLPRVNDFKLSPLETRLSYPLRSHRM